MSRKRNPLSKLAVLTDEQAEALLEFSATNGLAECCAHIAETYGITISKDGVSKWLQHERKDDWLVDIRSADKWASGVARSIGDQAQLDQSNIAMLATMLQTALLTGDIARVEQVTKAQSLVVGAATAQQKVTIAADVAALNRDKFEVESCERFLVWSNDERARGIVESSVPNAEKIAALRKTFFADVDAMQASGKVVLPE